MLSEDLLSRALAPAAIGVIATPEHEEGDEDEEGAERVSQAKGARPRHFPPRRVIVGTIPPKVKQAGERILDCRFWILDWATGDARRARAR